MTPFDLNWEDGIEAYFPAARLSVIERLTTSHGVPLIDPGARALLNSLERGSPIHEVVSSYQPNLHYGARLATVMNVGLPYLQDISLDEIIDLRESLADYLPAFRNAVLELSEDIGIDEGVDTREMGRKVSIAWTRKK
jgi:hypothetical protein